MSCALSLEDLEEVYFGLCQGRHCFLWLLLRRRWCLGMTLWTFTSQPIAGSKLRCLTDTCFNQSQSGNGGGIKVKFPQNIICILIFRRFTRKILWFYVFVSMFIFKVLYIYTCFLHLESRVKSVNGAGFAQSHLLEGLLPPIDARWDSQGLSGGHPGQKPKAKLVGRKGLGVSFTRNIYPAQSLTAKAPWKVTEPPIGKADRLLSIIFQGRTC